MIFVSTIILQSGARTSESIEAYIYIYRVALDVFQPINYHLLLW